MLILSQYPDPLNARQISTQKDMSASLYTMTGSTDEMGICDMVVWII